jgi:hypothetical protein
MCWNLNEFNVSSNTPEILATLSETMSSFDVIVLTEVMNPESSKPPLKPLAEHLEMVHKSEFMGEKYYSAAFINPKKLTFVGEQKRMLLDGRNNLKRPPSLYTLKTTKGGWQFNVLAVHLDTGKSLFQFVSNSLKGGAFFLLASSVFFRVLSLSLFHCAKKEKQMQQKKEAELLFAVQRKLERKSKEFWSGLKLVHFEVPALFFHSLSKNKPNTTSRGRSHNERTTDFHC